jgi:serine/threonine-protein kinase
MAEIYLAHATGPEGFEKEVVIKRVRAHLSGDESFVQMFIKEAQLASGLTHPHVVQIFDFGKHEDSYYLAMEYVRGCSLHDLRKRCRERGIRVPPVLVAHIGAQVAAGLHSAHRLKHKGEPLHLVHRDVTPQNVLLSFDGAVKLTDFGIAKAGNSFTQPGMLKGKFAYMSPEQARGEPVDARTDTFALGVVLWEMLTGGKLFDGDSEVAVLRSVQESVIAPPARLNPDVPEDLSAVVVKALERAPEARFQTAGELERALAQCVLRHAREVDDTDVGAFARAVFEVPLTQMTPAVPDRPAAAPTAEASARSAPPRESTAVMPGTGPAHPRPVRTPEPEDSLVSAPTLVLPRQQGTGSESSPGRIPAIAAAEQGSAPRPAPPVREARQLPTVSSASESPPAAKRKARGAWAGLAMALVALVAGVAVWMKPGAAPVSSPPAVQAPAVPAPEARTDSAAQPPAATSAPAPAPAEPPLQAQAPTEAPAPSTAPQPAVQSAPAKGRLVLSARPYATVFLDGRQVIEELQGTRTLSLAPGRYKLTFQHPSGSKSHEVTVEPNGKVKRDFIAPTP